MEKFPRLQYMMHEDVINLLIIRGKAAHGLPTAGFEPATFQSLVLHTTRKATAGLESL